MDSGDLDGPAQLHGAPQPLPQLVLGAYVWNSQRVETRAGRWELLWIQQLYSKVFDLLPLDEGCSKVLEAARRRGAEPCREFQDFLGEPLVLAQNLEKQLRRDGRRRDVDELRMHLPVVNVDRGFDASVADVLRIEQRVCPIWEGVFEARLEFPYNRIVVSEVFRHHSIIQVDRTDITCV